MHTYWLTFTDGSQGSCQGQSEYDAKRIAEHLSGKVVNGGEYRDIAAKQIPYPARPVVWQFDHPVSGKTPPFCYRPKECSGTSCRFGPACSE